MHYGFYQSVGRGDRCKALGAQKSTSDCRWEGGIMDLKWARVHPISSMGADGEEEKPTQGWCPSWRGGLQWRPGAGGRLQSNWAYGELLIKAREWQRAPEKDWKGEERLPLGHIGSNVWKIIEARRHDGVGSDYPAEKSRQLYPVLWSQVLPFWNGSWQCRACRQAGASWVKDLEDGQIWSIMKERHADSCNIYIVTSQISAGEWTGWGKCTRART